jgi:hypothetical protein
MPDYARVNWREHETHNSTPPKCLSFSHVCNFTSIPAVLIRDLLVTGEWCNGLCNARVERTFLSKSQYHPLQGAVLAHTLMVPCVVA